jgi:hypothetical protein
VEWGETTDCVDDGFGVCLVSKRVQSTMATNTDLYAGRNFKDHVLNAYIYLMNEYRYAPT